VVRFGFVVRVRSDVVRLGARVYGSQVGAQFFVLDAQARGLSLLTDDDCAQCRCLTELEEADDRALACALVRGGERVRVVLLPKVCDRLLHEHFHLLPRGPREHCAVGRLTVE
jgi:hypothetical protein